MAHVYALLTVFQINAIGLIITVGAGHVSHVHCPESFASAGQSLMHTKSKARRLKDSCLYSSHTRTPSSCQSIKRSSIKGCRNTSMSLPGSFGPSISTGIMMNLRFRHNQGGRLNIHRVTGHVL